MNTTGADGTKVGGGEILDWFGKAVRNGADYIDRQLEMLFKSVPYVKFLIYILLLVIMAYFILRVFNIKTPFKGKALKSELGNADDVKRRDLNILRANKFMYFITSLVESSPMKMDKNLEEYWQYNLNRADIKIPGKSRVIKATEFHALIVFIGACCCLVDLLVLITLNSFIGAMLLIITLICANFIPMYVVREIVKAKDLEIQEHFADFYLMIHYTLISRSGTPIARVMQSYDKTTTSKEMHRLVDNCFYYIDTYNEYNATSYISRAYREIPEIVKLMRLIRQSNEHSAEIEQELIAFRREVIEKKKYALEQKQKRIISLARMSFNVLMIVLVQAVLSAMSIYLTDMGLITSFIN